MGDPPSGWGVRLDTEHGTAGSVGRRRDAVKRPHHLKAWVTDGEPADTPQFDPVTRDRSGTRDETRTRRAHAARRLKGWRQLMNAGDLNGMATDRAPLLLGQAARRL